MNIAEIGTLVGIPIIRSVAGWLENALKDGSIDRFELKELGSTIIRVGMIGFGLFIGFDMSALAAAGSAVAGDFLLKALK